LALLPEALTHPKAFIGVPVRASHVFIDDAIAMEVQTELSSGDLGPAQWTIDQRGDEYRIAFDHAPHLLKVQ